jgi:hypothetical protein
MHRNLLGEVLRSHPDEAEILDRSASVIHSVAHGHIVAHRAISNQQSAISNQQSAISNQQSAISKIVDGVELPGAAVARGRARSRREAPWLVASRWSLIASSSLLT